MTLIPVEEDGYTISAHFRKAPKFAYMDEKETVHICHNKYKSAKSDSFFYYIDTLGIDTVYVKGLGRKSYDKLAARHIAIYHIADTVNNIDDITQETLMVIDCDRADTLCRLGHHKREPI